MAYSLILTTASSKKEAKKIASLLIKKKAAACVTLIPQAESYYRWKGKSETSQEILLFIKTRSKQFKAVEKIISEAHSYEVPEIIELPIRRGSKKYFSWINQSVS